MATGGGRRTITAREIVEAFHRTEIVPIKQTWDHEIAPEELEFWGTRVLRRPVTLRGQGKIPCGCALVALARAEGHDLEKIGAPYDRIASYADALGIDFHHARGILVGWDSEEGDEDALLDASLMERKGRFALGYRAGRDAQKEIARGE